MDPFRDFLDDWFRRHYREVLRRVTHRCARGDGDRAEDAIQTVLRRLWEYRDRLDTQGQSYRTRVRVHNSEIVIVLRGVNVLLTDYIVGGACNHLRRPTRWHDELSYEDEISQPAEDEAAPETDYAALIALVLPCLTRLNYNQFTALVLRLLDRFPLLRPHLDGFVGPQGIAYWQTRCYSTRGTDLLRARERLVEALWQEGVTERVFLELL